MFFFQVRNFADDTTIYSCSPNFEELSGTFLGSSIDNNKITFIMENKRAKSRSEVKLPSIALDDKLSFSTNIENLCSTISNCLRALAIICKFLSFEQAKRRSTLMYCPLILMFCSKRCLRVVYEMEDANFEDLLIRDNSWTIHEINTHTLVIEIYTSLNHISHSIMQEFFV